MSSVQEQLQNIAAELLSSGKVDLVIGYELGSAGIAVRPAFVTDADRASSLIYNSLCGHNLSLYLHRHKDKKVAIVAKPCDTRSLVGLIQERQINRDLLTILAVPCEGVIDPGKLEKTVPIEKIRQLSIQGDKLIIDSDDGQQHAPLFDLLSAGCEICTIAEPVISDQVLGTSKRKPGSSDDEFADIKTLAEKDPQQRWDDFCAEMRKCIACFACRNACPSCYCPTCFVDASGPKWLGKTDDLSDIQIFHITRMVHMAGRCTGCGACLRACPMGVNLQKYTGKIRLDAHELFDFEAGQDPEAQAPLSTYSPTDPNDFFM